MYILLITKLLKIRASVFRLRLIQTSRFVFLVDCGTAGDRKFPMPLQKCNRPLQVAANSQCSVNQS